MSKPCSIGVSAGARSRADAQRAEIILRAADGRTAARSRLRWALRAKPSGCGASGLPGIVSMASITSQDAVHHARSAMIGSRRLSPRRSRQSLRTRHIRARAAWRRRREYRHRPCTGSGRPSACSRIVRRRSSCRPIRPYVASASSNQMAVTSREQIKEHHVSQSRAGIDLSDPLTGERCRSARSAAAMSLDCGRGSLSSRTRCRSARGGRSNHRDSGGGSLSLLDPPLAAGQTSRKPRR